MLNYTVFENHPYNDDSTKLFGGTTFVCQTFTSGTAHEIYVVQMKLIRIGACGTVTLNLYDTDADGKPTGTSLATSTVAQSGVSTSATMVDFTLSPSYIVGNEKLAIVLSAAGALGTIGLRYKNVSVYTAGDIFSSTDSGSTWTKTLLSGFIFAEWGIPLPVHDATIIQLYPRKEGTYTQLQAATTAANWQQVADSSDSPDEESSYVAFNVSDNTGFLTGESDGAAGVVSGARAFWKSNGSGLWGEGTTFDTELAAGYLLKSPNRNEWFAKDWQRVAEISSVDSATAVSLVEACGPLSIDPSTSWFFTPATSADASAGKVQPHSEAHVNLPMDYLDGQWTWETGSKIVAGSSGNAKTIFPDSSVHPYAARGFLGTGRSTRSGTGMAYPVDTVDTDDQVTLYEEFAPSSAPGVEHEDLTGYTKYCFFGYYDDCTDEDKATMWCTKTKKDSYLVKQTLISGHIRRLDVVFRVCFYNRAFIQDYYTTTLKGDLSKLAEKFNFIKLTALAAYKAAFASSASSVKTELSTLASSYPAIASYVTATNTQIDSTVVIVNAFAITDDKDTIQTSYDLMLSSIASTVMAYVDQVIPTATAQPFLALSGTTVSGTEETLTPIAISVKEVVEESKWYSFKTYRQTLTRPGGGVFTLDDLNNLEVGITLGNISDFTNQCKVICTQIYADLYVSSTPLIKTQLVGMTQYGFKTFKNRMDEWALPVFSNGMNMLTHKIYRESTPFFARPLQILRGITSKIIRRKKTSSSPRRDGTSGSITQ